MSTGLLVALIVVAAAACPLHMWWQQRNGGRTFCSRSSGSGEPDDLRALGARQADLRRRLAVLSEQAPLE